jgi:hypothetical protein
VRRPILCRDARGIQNDKIYAVKTEKALPGQENCAIFKIRTAPFAQGEGRKTRSDKKEEGERYDET